MAKSLGGKNEWIILRIYVSNIFNTLHSVEIYVTSLSKTHFNAVQKVWFSSQRIKVVDFFILWTFKVWNPINESSCARNSYLKTMIYRRFQIYNNNSIDSNRSERTETTVQTPQSLLRTQFALFFLSFL